MTGKTKHRAKNTRIGNRKRSVLNLIKIQLLRAGAFRQITGSSGQTEKVQFTSILDDGNNQAPVQRNGDTEIDVTVVNHFLTIEAGV